MTENFNNFNKNNNDNDGNNKSIDKFDEYLLDVLKDYTTTSEYNNLNDSHLNLIDNLTYDDLLCDHYKMMAISDSTQLSDKSFDEQRTENPEHLSLAYENLKHIPKYLIDNSSKKIKCLDLSHNNLRNLTFLTSFKLLHTLILDRNVDLDEKTLPRLNNLEILWLNNCNILNITKWIHRIQEQCPNLLHLSILGNPGAKTKLVYGEATSDFEEIEFRNFIFELLPNLNYLDGSPTKFFKEFSDEKNLNQNINNNNFIQQNKTDKLLLQNNNGRRQNNGNKRNGTWKFANSIKDLFRFNGRRNKNINQPSSSTN